MSLKEKDKEIKKGRRWRFSKKKMKENDDTRILQHDLKELLEKEGKNLKPRVGSSKSSKLSPSLLEILKKSIALGYFLEYLQECDKKHLLDFWLEAETLHMVAETNYLRRTCSDSRRYSRSSSMSSNSSRSPAKTNYTKQELENSSKTFSENSTKNNNSTKSNNSTNSFDSACFCPDADSDGTHENKLDDTGVELNMSPISEADDRVQIKTKNLDAIHPSNHEWDTKNFVDKDQKVDTAMKTSSSPLSEKGDDKRKSSSLRSYTEFKQRAKTRDAVSIYSKYISLNADLPINLPSSERQIIEGTICRDENNLDPQCFVKAQEFAFEQLEGIYDEFLSTTNMMTYQLMYIQEKVLKLQDVLYDEGILFFFLEFLDLHNAKSAYEFYITAESFEEDVEHNQKECSYDKDTVVNDAMHIYERYFSMKCEEQLIADDKLRIVLENNICREDGPQSNCFCIPMAYAWTALSEIYLPMFLKSATFTAYEQHLQRTLQRGEDMKSCCSSTRSSVSLEDQFPLMQKSEFPTMLQKSESKLNLFDEHSLEDFWFKPLQQDTSLSASRLTLGHVSEFGVFSSGMEEHPPDETSQDSSVTKLGKKMKNLLRGETPEETEQLAWERARKIIGDIQKQTQS